MTDWMADATCKTEQIPTSVFYPEDYGQALAAKRICNRCPVAKQCEAHARREHEYFGIWGGLSERARARKRATPLTSTLRNAKTPWGEATRALLATPGWWTIEDVADAIAPVVAESRLLSEANSKRSREGRGPIAVLPESTRRHMTSRVASTLVANLRKRGWLDERDGLFRLKEQAA